VENDRLTNNESESRVGGRTSNFDRRSVAKSEMIDQHKYLKSQKNLDRENKTNAIGGSLINTSLFVNNVAQVYVTKI